MKKKIFIGFGAVVILLLLVSNATAVINTQVYDFEEKDDDNIFIDPNIHLSRIHLSKLRRSIKGIRNSDYAKYEGVINQIINLIDENGEINSEDIRNIIEVSNIQVRGVYSGVITAQSNGAAVVFPGTILLSLFGPIIGFGQLLCWTASNEGCKPGEENIQISIGGNILTHEHRGLALGFFGFGSNGFDAGSGYYIWPVFGIVGFVFLAFVS